jgi:colicin import membrane protein
MKGAAGNGRNAVQLPLLLTTAIHLGALLLAVFAPKLIPEPPPIPKVYQVELYTAPEVQPGPQPASPANHTKVETPSITAPPPPAPAPPKAQSKPTIATPVSPPAHPKAISLSPLKKQLAQENREREEQIRRVRQVNDRVTQLKLDLQQQQADEKLREAIHLVREALVETHRAVPARPVPIAGNPTNPQANVAATGANLSTATNLTTSGHLEARAAYVARLREHLRRNWKLPVLQDWDEKLSAKIVIKIKRDGSVTTTWFEKHSTNSRFDQYVKKAVDRSSPLPPLPREFEQKSEEIAVTFTPGGLN